ncbi:MAG: adenylosuccinate synthase [Verrucomicrobiota bacterium]
MNTVLIGAQWGDEGKGKIIDVLAERNDVVVRMQGGSNAGHSVHLGEKKFVLHLVPSGILWNKKICVIANGVVIDPIGLIQEIRDLEKRGIRTRGKLFISETAHLVLPYHRVIDEGRELAATGKIGTTKRGIGPAYADKAYRVGFRVIDLFRPEKFKRQIHARVDEINALARGNSWPIVSAEKIAKEYLAAGRKLKPYVANSVLLLHAQMKLKKKILFEGAQGTFLDIDHGTYPYVTSSNTTAGGACTGTGIPPHAIDQVIGVMKAYTTRVGEGPLPTYSKTLSAALHSLGREFGATTGRPRRCGWFDSVITRHAQRVNGIDSLAVTNLDGLDALEEIKVCVAYRLGKKQIDYPPSESEDLARCKPVYKIFKGWKTSTSHARHFKDLPLRAQIYLKALSKFTGAPLGIISVGARRDETFFYGK